MIRVAIGSRAVFGDGELPEALADDIRGLCEHQNAKFWALKRMRLPTIHERPIERTWACECGLDARKCRCGTLSIPLGVLPDALARIRQQGHSVRTSDMREMGLPIDKPLVYQRALRSYQEEAIQKLMAVENGLLRAPTASGKTSILIALAARLNVRSLVVVHSSALLSQWVIRVREELGIEPGIIQGSRCELRPVTLAMQKTLWVRGIEQHVAQYFGALLCDEVHLFSARSFRDVVDASPAKYRFGVSADQRRKDGKEYLIHDMFGPVVADIDRAELVADGHVIPAEVLVYPTSFVADWYGIPEDENDGHKLDVVRLHQEMAADADRNASALEAALTEARSGKIVFVMAHERAHVRALAGALSAVGEPAGLLLGGPESKKEFDNTLRGLKNGSIRVGVGTYQAIGTGIDVPGVEAVICVTPIASNRQFFGQVIGRACRSAPGKTSARVHYFWDQNVFGNRHVENLAKWNDVVNVRDGPKWVDAKQWLRLRR